MQNVPRYYDSRHRGKHLSSRPHHHCHKALQLQTTMIVEAFVETVWQLATIRVFIRHTTINGFRLRWVFEAAIDTVIELLEIYVDIHIPIPPQSPLQYLTVPLFIARTTATKSFRSRIPSLSISQSRVPQPQAPGSSFWGSSLHWSLQSNTRCHWCSCQECHNHPECHNRMHPLCLLPGDPSSIGSHNHRCRFHHVNIRCATITDVGFGLVWTDGHSWLMHSSIRSPSVFVLGRMHPNCVVALAGSLLQKSTVGCAVIIAVCSFGITVASIWRVIVYKQNMVLIPLWMFSLVDRSIAIMVICTKTKRFWPLCWRVLFFTGHSTTNGSSIVNSITKGTCKYQLCRRCSTTL